MSTKENKSRAQIEYEKHVVGLRKLHIPEPIQTWDELSEFMREAWEKEYPEIDTDN